MALSEGTKENFQTILDAAKHGQLALLECTRDGKPVPIIVAVNREDNGDVSFVPFAQMFEGNPYEILTPPE